MRRIILACALAIASCAKPAASPPTASASAASSSASTSTQTTTSESGATANVPPPSAEELVCTGSGPKAPRVCNVSSITPSVKAALERDPDRGHLLVVFPPTATQAQFDTVAQLPWLSHVSIKGAKQVTSLGALASLTQLRKVNLSDSGIKSLGPLRAATEIDKLEAAGCPLDDTDLSALAPMHRLKYLDLARSGDKLTDLSALASLEELDLVNVTGAAATNIDFAGKLPKLTRFFAPAKVDDLGPLSGAVQLHALSIEAAKPRDFRPIAKLVNLTSLRLVDVGLKDASPIAGLAALETLSLANNPLKDLAPLAKLTKLRSLDVSGTKATSIAPVAKLPLEWLDARGAPIKDWKALASSTTLRSVKVDASAPKDAVDALKKALPNVRVEVE